MPRMMMMRARVRNLTRQIAELKAAVKRLGGGRGSRQKLPLATTFGGYGGGMMGGGMMGGGMMGGGMMGGWE